jgi:hypothetical protein
MSRESISLRGAWIALLCLSATLPSVSRAQKAPVFVVTPQVSTIRFFVKSSINIEGKFDKWGATLKFTSPDTSTGVWTSRSRQPPWTREAASRTTN